MADDDAGARGEGGAHERRKWLVQHDGTAVAVLDVNPLVGDIVTFPFALAHAVVGIGHVFGGDFAETAEKHSDDSAASKGGDRGWVKKGFLADDLWETALALEPGQFSKVIEDDTLVRIETRTDRRGIFLLCDVPYASKPKITAQRGFEPIVALQPTVRPGTDVEVVIVDLDEGR